MSRPKDSVQDSLSHQWQPAGVAIGAMGVDLRPGTKNRQVEALTELTNATFPDEKTIGRRAGHTSTKVEYPGSTRDYFKAISAVQSDDRWVYGYGSLLTLTVDGPAGFSLADSWHRHIRGIASRDNEVVAWTGDRLLSFGGEAYSGGPGTLGTGGITAKLPAMVSTPLALSDPHDGLNAYYDYTMTDAHHVVVYTSESIGYPRVSVTSLATGAIVYEQIIGTSNDYTTCKLVYANRQIIAYLYDTTANQIFQTYATEDTPWTWSTPEAVANSDSGIFDLCKISDSRYLLAWVDDTGANPIVKGTYFLGSEVASGPAAAAATISTLGTKNTETTALAVAVGPDTSVALVWVDKVTATSMSISCSVVSADFGTEILATDTFDTVGPQTVTPAVAVAPELVYVSGKTRYLVFANTQDASSATWFGVRRTTLTQSAGASSGTVRHHCRLASSAFRVGNDVCVWLATYRGIDSATWCNPVQYSDCLFLLVDDHIAGFAEIGRIDYLTTGTLAGTGRVSVAPDPLAGAYGDPMESNITKWGTVTAGQGSVTGIAGTQWELTIRELDFLPPLRSAQFGRSTYFAGAAVQVYDGASLVEVGCPIAPFVTLVSSNTGPGGLDNAGVYRYRVYLAHDNAQSETTRSPCATATITLGGSDDTVTLAVNYVPCTNKTTARFEVYRTEGGGTTFYYAGTTDKPALGTATVSYVDTLADSALILNAVDPFNPAIGQASELEETCPRACEIIISAGDRLWLAGGDIPPGSVDFSKLRESGEQAGFSDVVGTVVVDPDGRPVKSMSALGDGIIVFTDTNPLVLVGDGPDNLGNGFFRPASVIQGPGATTHEGTCQVEPGVVYWSSKGPKLLTTGLQVVDISAPVEPLSRTLAPTGCCSPAGLREVRWYTSGGTALLWDYTGGQGRWAVWEGIKAVGVTAPGAARPYIAVEGGFVWQEDQDVHTDAGAPFEFVWRLSGIRPADVIMGSNKVRHVGVSGEYKGPHTLRLWFYYDGSEFWEQRLYWNPQTDINFGGTWDDDTTVWDAATTTYASPDAVYRFLIRPTRQSCATFSIRVSDGAPANNSYVPHEFFVEIGAMTGPTNMPTRTYT